MATYKIWQKDQKKKRNLSGDLVQVQNCLPKAGQKINMENTKECS